MIPLLMSWDGDICVQKDEIDWGTVWSWEDLHKVLIIA